MCMKKSLFINLVFFLVLLCVWEIVSRHVMEYRFILPPVSSILVRIWEHSDVFIDNSKATLREMAGGFILALLAAFPLAWMMYLWKSARTALQPLFIVLQSIPMFTLAPIMVLWFGWTYMAIVVPTALMIFLPLTLNIYQGLISTPRGLLEYFKINQATRWQTFSKLQLPSALPHVFAGLRISAAFAGIGAIAGEWAGAQSGLGVLMLKSRRATDLETTFGALLCLISISLALYGIIAYAERRYKQHKPMRSFSIITLCVFLGTIIFIANPFHNQTSPTKVTRLLLDWLPNSNHVPIYAGLKKKIFAKHHMHLQVLELQDPSDTISYLTFGKVDIALFYMPDVVKANQKGADLNIAGVLIDKALNSFIFREDAQIQFPKDLSGKVIGYCVAGSNLSILERLLKENHIEPKELKNVSFDLVTLLGLRQVDVIYGAFWNIEKEQLKSLHIPTSHFEVSQLGHPPYSELVFLGKGDISKFEAFKKAMQESIDYCKANPDEAFDLYSHCHPEKGPHTLAWEKEAWLKTIPLLAHSQEIAHEDWERLQTWLNQ